MRRLRRDLLSVVRSHHEMLDGSGYPDRLRGGEIPDLVRLVTICDIHAALIERRPYKAPMDAGKAYAILESMAGRLDADLVRAFQPVVQAYTPAACATAGPPAAACRSTEPRATRHDQATRARPPINERN